MANRNIKSPVPILFLITELHVGGAQTALWRLLENVDRGHYSPIVACLYNGNGTTAKKTRALGISVFDLGMTNKARLDAFVRLYQLLRRERPLILHTWMFHANIPGRVLGRLAGVPIIISSERTMGQEGYLRRVINHYTAPLADCVVCVSQHVAEFATNEIGIPLGKIAVIPNGVAQINFENLPNQTETRAAFQLPEKAIIIGAIGRPRPVKGCDILLEAFALLTFTYPLAHLLFVGDGPDQEKLKVQAARLNIANQVTFLNDQDNITNLLPALDMLVNSSLFEGMSNSILEAMAAGLPVVATNVGGTPEVVVDGQTGLLVPPHDPVALSEAILHLLQNPDLRRRFGQSGRKRVEAHFSIKDTVKKTEQLYSDLLARELGGILP